MQPGSDAADRDQSRLLVELRCSFVVMRRLKVISGHLARSGPDRRDLRRTGCPAAAEDVVVVHGRRTAIGKAKRGSFKVK